MKLIRYTTTSFVFLLSLGFFFLPVLFSDIFGLSKKEITQLSSEKKSKASYQFSATGGLLAVGSENTVDNTNIGSWRGTLGNDGNYWSVTRNATTGLDMQLYFDGINLQGGNKLFFYIEASNTTTTSAYTHQICDWVSTTGVNVAADSNCTGGGWRTLQHRAANYTATSDTAYQYEIYDGYFSTRSATPGTYISTPLSNFIGGGSNRVLIRTYSTVASAVIHKVDYAQLEVAIDPAYEAYDLVKTNAGTTTNYISDTIGRTNSGTGNLGSDNTRMTIPMSAISTNLDFYFKYKNIKTYSDMNTIVVAPELCVSNTALTFGIYLRRFSDNTWQQVGSNITGSACTTDTDYTTAFNSTTISGFNLSDYISGSNEVWVRFYTNAPGTVYNMQIDSLYILLGSVNTDSAQCAISWGAGTASNCANTRSMINDVTSGVSTANTTTWQTSNDVEYPAAGYHPGDNDDDTTNSEYAFSSNLNFPLTVSSAMSITAMHYSLRFRSNSATITLDPQLRNYGGMTGIGGEQAGAGWRSTPGTDTNAATTYNYFDSVRLTELIESPQDYVDTVHNIANIRLRTSVSTNTAGGVSNDWDFAMVSLRWVEETNRNTVRVRYAPSGGQLAVGSEVTVDNANVGSWRGAVGQDSTTNGSSNYWTTARNASGLDKQLYFDGVELYDANKIIVTIKDTNITNAEDYIHQICDWITTTGVDNSTDSNCTGGGWRTLQTQRLTNTAIADATVIYEVYNGYFSTRDTSPGTVVDTPLSNFVRSSDHRVLIRTYSTVNSSTQHRTDYALVEVAIDPFYEPAEFVNTSGGTTTNYMSDLIGANYSAYTTGTDGSKLTISMPSSNNAIDGYFVFKNVKPYTGANTILFNPEICVSNTALTFGIYIRKFSDNSWRQVGTTITGSACTTDTSYSTAINDSILPSSTLSDYISSSNEVWVRFVTSAPASVYTMQIDSMYMMIGSVNTDSSKCEISWGTGTATNCTNTRDMTNQVVSGTLSTSTTSTWQVTSALEYPSGYHALDNDDDTTNGEHAWSANLSFPVTISNDEMVTGVHYAARFRSNITSMTETIQYKDFATLTGLGGEVASSGWRDNPASTTNALTTFTYTDTWLAQELRVSPDDFVDTVSNLTNLRFRTSVSTNTTTSTTGDIDFAMSSIRYIQPSTAVVSITVSDASVSYGLVAKGATQSTSALSDTQTVTNNGNVSEQINIKGQNTACPWTLSSSAGNNQYVHQFCKASDVSCSAPPTNYTPLTTSYQTLYSSVAASSSKNFDLAITLPTDSSCYNSQSVDVMLQAVAQ